MGSLLEVLESRIAPATLLDAKTVAFTDINDDIVHVQFSKGVLTANNWENFFVFQNAGGAHEVLLSLDLTDSLFAGSSVKVNVTEIHGDGIVDIGVILAGGNDLGSVSVQGGLVKIEAGDNLTPAKGLAALTVGSLGVLNPADFGLADRVSLIHGKLGALNVGGDVAGSVFVDGGTDANIGSIKIGGSLLAGAGDQTGWITTTGNIGNVTVGTIDGRLADGNNEAGIISGGKLGNLTVHGSIIAGEFASNGVVSAALSVGKVSIQSHLGRDLNGVVGAGIDGGSIIAGGTMGSVFIGGSVLGGAGKFSGSIHATANIGKVTILGSVLGDAGDNSGFIGAGGKIGNVSIGSNIQGSSGEFSGAISGLQGLSTVKVGGSLLGGTGLDSGVIQAGSENANASISKVFITGVVQGNSGIRSATVLAWGGNMSQAWVGGDVTGGAGLYSSLIYATNHFGKAHVGGDLIGGAGDFSGRVATDAGNLDSVIIGGNFEGGLGANSGTIYAGGKIGSLMIGGAMTGGAGDFSGSVGILRSNPAPAIKFSEKIGKIFIGTTAVPGSVTGGSGDYSGAIGANSSISDIFITGDLKGGGGFSSGEIEVSLGSLSNVKVGNIEGGQNSFTGRVYAGTDLKKMTVLGSVTGSDYSYSGSIIGSSTIGKVEIGGSLVGGNNSQGDTQRTGAILSGKIGSIKIGGDIKSGAKVDPAKFLTDSGAIRAITTIGSLTVDGSLIGTAEVPVLITAQLLVGPVASNVTIGSIDIKTDVHHALILAGVDLSNPVKWSNPFAQIKSVTVGGDWEASSISAGAQPGPNGYGAGDTVSPNLVAPNVPSGTFSKIGKISIAGAVTGGADGEQYGFVAANFGPVVIGGQKLASPLHGMTSDVIPDGKVKIHRL